jgi:hypothetical protein
MPQEISYYLLQYGSEECGQILMSTLTVPNV